MEKKNALLLAASIIIILIIAGILAYFFWPSEYKQAYSEQYKDCTIQNKEYYLFLMAKKTGDVSYCEQKNTLKDKCMAFATRNPDKYCLGLEGNADAICKAEVLQDASKCPKDDNWCIATASGDPKFCEKLDTEDIEECKRLLPQNAEYWISEEANKECKEIATSAAESIKELKSI